MIEKKNFLDEYTKYAATITDAPLDFHRYVAYTVVSTVVNTGVWFPFGRKRIYPNLWIILLAPSGLSRKSTSSDIGREILLQYKRNLVLPNEFSQEKICSVLAQNSQGTFFFSEFLSFMGLLQRDYMAGTKAFFTEMYDCPFEYQRQTVKETMIIRNPFINILSCTTIDWFLDTVKEGDIAGGFLARFIMVPGGKKARIIDIPPQVDDRETSRITTLLYEFVERRGQLVYDAKAREEYRAWYAKFEAVFPQTDKRIQSFLIRLPVYLIKFSMLEAICAHEKEISIKSFNTAKQNVTWIFQKLREISQDFEFSKAGRERQKVMKLIQSSGISGIQHSILLRTSHLSNQEFKMAIETLMAQDQVVKMDLCLDGSKRLSIVYFDLEHAKIYKETRHVNSSQLQR